MLNKGILLLSITIDLLIQILIIIEWINPLNNILILTAGGLIFRSRWTWQVLIPSIIIYKSSNIKAYFKDRIKEIESLGKLDLLLRANSLTQHALFLKDRIIWLYNTELNFLIESLKGDLSFEVKLLLIACIIIFFGFFNLSPLILEITVMHLLLKHSKLGQFYANKILTDSINYIKFCLFYKDLEFYPFPPPFKLEDEEFIIEIVEIIQDDIVSFQSLDLLITPEALIQLKPIVSEMIESISHWQTDLSTHKSVRNWKWTRTIKFDYNEEEWNYFRNIYNLLQG